MAAQVKVPGGYMVDPGNGLPAQFIPDSAAPMMGLADAPPDQQMPGATAGSWEDPNLQVTPEMLPPEMGMQAQSQATGIGQTPPPPPMEYSPDRIVDQAPIATGPEAMPAPPSAVGREYSYQKPSTGFPQPRQSAPSGVARMKGGAGNVMKGLAIQADAQQRAADAESIGLQQEALTIAEQAAKEQQAWGEQQRREDEVAQNARRELDEVKAMKVNPDNWWQTRSTGQSIMAVIGAGLAGYINPRGKNGMMEIIDKYIQRDLDAQQANIQNKQWAYGQSRGLMADLMQRGMNQAQARQAAYVMQLNHVKALTAAEASKYKSPEIEGRSLAAQGQIDMDLGEKEQAFTNNAIALNNTRLQMGLEERKFQYAKDKDAAEAKAKADASAVNGYVRDNRVMVNVLDKDGKRTREFVDYAPDTKGREKAADFGKKVAAANYVVWNLDETLKLDLSTDPRTWNAERVKAAQHMAVVAAKAVEMIAGVPSDSDAARELAKFANMTDPAAMSNWLQDNRKILTTYRGIIQKQMDVDLQQVTSDRTVQWEPEAPTGTWAPEESTGAEVTDGSERADRFRQPWDKSAVPERNQHARDMKDIEYFGQAAAGESGTLGKKADNARNIGTSGLAYPPEILLEEKKRQKKAELDLLIAARENGAPVDIKRIGHLEEEIAEIGVWQAKARRADAAGQGMEGAAPRSGQTR